MVDTGAQITLVSIKLIREDIMLHQLLVSLTGITGNNYAISTRGCFNGDLVTENGTHWPTEIHAVDEEFAGTYDGYLRFNFMLAYNVVIDFANKTIQLHSGINNENCTEKSTITEIHDEQSDTSSNSDANCLNDHNINICESQMNMHSADAPVNTLELENNIVLSNNAHFEPHNIENLHAQRAQPSAVFYPEQIQMQQSQSFWNANNSFKNQQSAQKHEIPIETMLSNPEIAKLANKPENELSTNEFKKIIADIEKKQFLDVDTDIQRLKKNRNA